MDIKDWGEEDFIQNLTKLFPRIGDDAAVIPEKGKNNWLVTTDALVEGVHFLKDQISPLDLGYKTVAVNVSDIAAMGGVPRYALLTIALPKTIEWVWVDAVIQGIQEACKKWDLELVGGDTVGSKRDVFLNLTLIGSAPSSHIKYRNLAKPGDIVCVTGCLGNSGGGLKALQNQVKKTKEVKSLLSSHFRPEPPLQQGIWLGSQPSVHAMMDLSDGLDCDLRRMIKQSHCGAIVEVDHIPLSESLVQVCSDHGWDSLSLALAGGEDYCLLLTVSPHDFSHLQSSFQNKFCCPLYEIGRIIEENKSTNLSQKR